MYVFTLTLHEKVDMFHTRNFLRSYQIKLNLKTSRVGGVHDAYHNVLASELTFLSLCFIDDLAHAGVFKFH
jgi:hypothetical protein